MALSPVRAHFPDMEQLKLQHSINMVVVGTNIMEEKGVVHTALTGRMGRQSLGPMTGSTGAAISAIRRPGRQRLSSPIPSGLG